MINGEKWFTSAGRIADLLFVMCTNGMFVVPRATPGVEIMPEPRNHNHIVYRDVRVPLDHLLGPENGDFAASEVVRVLTGQPPLSAVNAAQVADTRRAADLRLNGLSYCRRWVSWPVIPAMSSKSLST